MQCNGQQMVEMFSRPHRVTSLPSLAPTATICLRCLHCTLAPTATICLLTLSAAQERDFTKFQAMSRNAMSGADCKIFPSAKPDGRMEVHLHDLSQLFGLTVFNR